MDVAADYGEGRFDCLDGGTDDCGGVVGQAGGRRGLWEEGRTMQGARGAASKWILPEQSLGQTRLPDHGREILGRNVLAWMGPIHGDQARDAIHLADILLVRPALPVEEEAVLFQDRDEIPKFHAGAATPGDGSVNSWRSRSSRRVKAVFTR